MLKNRAFTGLAALSLALGIGANTAIYSVMDAILMRSLPVAHPDSLVVVKWRRPPFAFGVASNASELIQSLLFDLQPNDPRALTLAVAILLTAALLAGYASARRASRVDPLVALRHA